MKVHLLIVLAVAATTALAPTPANAWGREGHSIVAAIAEAHLTPQAREAIDNLLSTVEPGSTMESVAGWADTVRTRDTSHWHFMNYPQGDCAYRPPVECADGNCLVQAFHRELTILADTAQPLQDRETALKFVIHLTGDAEMPLHDWAPDHGGNGYQVQFGGRGTNIHHVWDTELIRQYAMAPIGQSEQGGTMMDNLAAVLGEGRPDYRAYTRTLISESFAVPYSPSTDPIAWTQSACRVANRSGILPGREVTATYVAHWRPVVEVQLIKAGLQLAAVLNEAFGPPHA
ncbi:S1/P1 nuclease [Rhodanobacter sp. FW106-PBR-R2A-1-13]|uniref:S1/P1 nuclease n=1 Tax=Rhodanobacter sp. FW106-PBR-R2A-1-13 TaxID=3454845 RepID=UPI0034E3C15E